MEHKICKKDLTASEFNTDAEKKARYDEYTREVLNAEIIGEKRRDVLSRKSVKTFEENMSIDRYDLETFWGLSIDDNPEIIEWTVVKRWNRLVMARENYLKNRGVLATKDRMEIEKEHVATHKHRLAQRDLLDNVFKILGIDDIDGDYDFYKTSPRVIKLIEWMNVFDNGQKCKDLLDINVRGKAAANEPVRIIESMLKKVGIVLGESVRKTIDGERVGVKSTNQEMNQFIGKTITRRAGKRSSSSVKLDGFV